MEEKDRSHRLRWVKKRGLSRVVVFRDKVHGKNLDEFETMRVEKR
jgi:hypothetical protein